MSAERFKLVVEGIEEGADLEEVKLAVSERFNIPASRVHRLFGQSQVTLKDDLDKDVAWHVQRLLEDMSVRSKVVPMPLSNLHLSALSLESEPSGRFAAVDGATASSASVFEARSPAVKTPVARKRSTQVRNEPVASWKLSSLLLWAGAVVITAYLIRHLFTF
jgi:hypothetical protein